MIEYKHQNLETQSDYPTRVIRLNPISQLMDMFCHIIN